MTFGFVYTIYKREEMLHVIYSQNKTFLDTFNISYIITIIIFCYSLENGNKIW